MIEEVDDIEETREIVDVLYPRSKPMEILKGSCEIALSSLYCYMTEYHRTGDKDELYGRNQN